MNCYVYLFECVPVGIHKIGYAREPEKRMRELERKALGPCRYVYGIPWGIDHVEPWQTASCQPYRLLWCAPAEDRRAAERVLHKRFADKRIEIENWPQCEWFTLDAVDIDYIRSIERFEGGTAILGQPGSSRVAEGTHQTREDHRWRPPTPCRMVEPRREQKGLC